MREGPSQPVIDARPRGPRGLLAETTLLGQPILRHHVELCRSLGLNEARILAPEGTRERLTSLLELEDGLTIEFIDRLPSESAFLLSTDRLYARRRLRRALRRGDEPDSAAIWRLDTPARIEAAEQEWIRRRTYQPIGQYWALDPARWLARSLSATPIGPNVLTVLGAAAVLAATGLLVWWIPPGVSGRLVITGILVLAMILDMADGHLARLQGSCTSFGRWLDGFLDECADMCLHFGVALSQFLISRNPFWLVLGIVYGMGKFAFAYGNLTWESVHKASHPCVASSPTHLVDPPATLRQVAIMVGHADVRWHLWIVLSAAGWLHFELLVFAAYYPLRTLFGVYRKWRQATHG